MVPAVIVSAIVALLYTAFGQLISVAYTDIVQLVFMVLGMVRLQYAIYLNLNASPCFHSKHPYCSKYAKRYINKIITGSVCAICNDQ